MDNNNLSVGSSLSGSHVFISGGTGSFGRTLAKDLLERDINKVTVYSRDEKKQDDMRKEFDDERLNFIIGDVRDKHNLKLAMEGANKVFHAAALKQVPSCEFYPMEAVKTNVIGANNILDVGVELGVENIVVLSTDKAVYPINTMGMSKALMEKCAVAKARFCVEKKRPTKINITRYGNVMGSRGSVIPIFIKLARLKENLGITHPKMTRFLMSLDDSVDLVYFAFNEARHGDLVVKKSPASDVQTIADAVNSLCGQDVKRTTNIGIRHGEKLHETLCSSEEMAIATDCGDFYTIPADFRDLNYRSLKTVSGEDVIANAYTSATTSQLDHVEVMQLIKKQNFYKELNT